MHPRRITPFTVGSTPNEQSGVVAGLGDIEIHQRPAGASPQVHRWPGLQTILGASVVAALVVGIDTYFSAEEGYLSQPPNYEGVGYLQFARSASLLLRHLHFKTALAEMNSIAPLWTYLQTIQYLVLGDGTWQAFTVRFWPVALLLVLVYWIVRARGTRAMAIAALVLTAVMPMVSASVRASSWELLSGQANYPQDWGLDDLRPDFLAAVLVLWSIAAVVENHRAPRRAAYVVSTVFAAAAVLTKPSTAPAALAAWGLALGLLWLWRRDMRTLRLSVLAGIVLVILLIPWGIAGGGFLQTVSRLHEGAVTYGATYFPSVNLVESITYYLVQLPNQLGQVEAVVVIPASLLLLVLMLRRRLDRSEVVYAAVAAFFYVVFTIPTGKNPNVGEWFALSVWIFFLAGASRLIESRWPATALRASSALLAVVGVFALLVYSVGAVALASWPDRERLSNRQLEAVTVDLAHELGRHISNSDCFTYAPGPGWPASIQYLMMDADGGAPGNTAIDVDPTTTTTVDYVSTAKRCTAVIVYRDDLSQVGRVFYVPAVRQPYLRALAQWVRAPDSGYTLDRSWTFTDLAPSGQHALGRYQGVTLTVDLYIRSGR